jgi:hypothetical protein
LLLSTTLSINAILLIPSSTPGKSSHSFFGISPLIFAFKVKAKLRYRFADASKYPSGCPAGILAIGVLHL